MKIMKDVKNMKKSSFGKKIFTRTLQELHVLHGLHVFLLV